MGKPTIVFDLGGVLIDWNPRYLFRKLFNGRSDDMEFFLNTVCTRAWNHQMDEGRPFAAAVADKVAEFPEYEPYITAYHIRWSEMIAGTIEGTVAILSELVATGYQTAVISNWPPDTFHIVEAQFEFLSWFDEIILSSDHNVAKPDPAIYHILLERIGRQAAECLFIDDLITNIQAARALGFRGIHFQSPEQLRAELNELGLLD